jgi:muramoyltetrapeptide carboxypeptidase
MKVPPFLWPGDAVAVINVSKRFDEEEIQTGIARLKKWKLRVLEGPHLYANDDPYFGASDEEKLFDIHWAFNHPEVKAIFFARGGYGVQRLLERIPFEIIQKNPKWCIGFSDLTALHQALVCKSIPAIHGPVIKTFPKRETPALEAFRNVLFGGLPELKWKGGVIKSGKAEGKLIGGNLSLWQSSIDTPFETKHQDSILFLEEVGEDFYRVERMLLHLKRSGRLSGLAGLVFGQFTDCAKGNPPFNDSIENVLASLTKELKIPAVMHFPAGHGKDNYPLILGLPYELKVSQQMSTLRCTYSL